MDPGVPIRNLAVDFDEVEAVGQEGARDVLHLGQLKEELDSGSKCAGHRRFGRRILTDL